MRLTLLILTLLPLSAQTPIASPPSLRRPRIGLVLEGGGALGLAHIGVLDWIEKNHIPIDYVAGTSMGGLVGGLYASGLSPQAIRELTASFNWDEILKGQIPFQDRSYRRKQDKVDYPNRLEFGLRGGFNLPAGLNSGQDVSFILDRALLPYFEMKSFNDLPIPFRCVATDLNRGEKKVFDSGTLAHALRATMSIPLLFAPVTIDGHTYTDGAAVDNLPVDVVKEMGADIIIAVYLDTGPVDPKTFNSIIGAASRNIAIMIAANEFQSLKLADIVVSVDLKKFTSSDFGLGEKIVPLGYDAAAGKEALLSKLSVSPNEWTTYTVARSSRIRQSTPAPEFITVSGVAAREAGPVVADLRAFVGKPVDSVALENRLTKLTGLGYFDSLTYGLTTENGKTGLAIKGQEKPYGPPFLNLSVTLDGSEPTSVNFGMAARLTFLNVGGFRSEWRTDAFFGTNYGVRTEYYKPFSSTSKWFVAPHAYATALLFDIYNDNTLLAEYRQRRDGFGVDAGYTINAKSEIRVGQDLAWYGTKRVAGPILANNSTTMLGLSSVRYSYFGQDSSVLPRNGFINQTSFQWFTDRPGGGGYPSLESRSTYFKSVSKKASVFVGGSGGTAFSSSDLELQDFVLGGPFRLGAYGRNELLGSQYFLFQGGATYEMFRLNPLIGTNVSVVSFYEVGKIYGNSGYPTLPMDGTVAIVMRTAFGPFYAGASLGDNSHRRWWFGLGRIF